MLGSRWTWMGGAGKRSSSVKWLRWWSIPCQRNHSCDAWAKVAPVRTMPGSAPARAGEQLVEDGLSEAPRQVASGRPRRSTRDRGGRWTWRPSGRPETHVRLRAAGALDEESVAGDGAAVDAER